MGKPRRPCGRNIQGILLFDKPAGMSSNAALQEVKQLFFAKKAGHTGSLDPLATGLLPICFGRATRISSFLLDADKQYDVICQLGVSTITGDAEGEVKQIRTVPELSRDRLDKLIQSSFTGRISQIPPMYSALKHKGKRLYDLARKGIKVEREPREVMIHALTINSLQGDELGIHVHCSKGTYIRTLVEDIGEALGAGAHVKQLRRTAVLPFSEPEMVTLEKLRRMKEDDVASLDGLLLPSESALMQFPEVHLSEDSTFYLKRGQAVQVSNAPTSGWVRLYSNQDQFMGMGAIQDDGKVAPRRLFG